MREALIRGSKGERNPAHRARRGHGRTPMKTGVPFRRGACGVAPRHRGRRPPFAPGAYADTGVSRCEALFGDCGRVGNGALAEGVTVEVVYRRSTPSGLLLPPSRRAEPRAATYRADRGRAPAASSSSRRETSVTARPGVYCSSRDRAVARTGVVDARYRRSTLRRLCAPGSRAAPASTPDRTFFVVAQSHEFRARCRRRRPPEASPATRARRRRRGSSSSANRSPPGAKSRPATRARPLNSASVKTSGYGSGVGQRITRKALVPVVAGEVFAPTRRR